MLLVHPWRHTTIHAKGFKILGISLGFHASSAPLKEYYTPGQTKEPGRKVR